MRGLIPYLVGLLLTYASPLAAQSPDQLSTAEQAEVINRVLTRRMALLHDTTRYDACSLFLAFGRDADFRTRLDPRVRERVTEENVNRSCHHGAARSTPRGRWVLYSITRTAPGAVIVRARTVGEPTFDETYVVRHDPPGRGSFYPWVDEIRLSEFVDT